MGWMEGVEDIPGSALTEGMTWNWESFPEYRDALERLDRTVDVAAQVPHGAVRAYVMGDRGAANEEPTETKITRMSTIVEEEFVRARSASQPHGPFCINPLTESWSPGPRQQKKSCWALAERSNARDTAFLRWRATCCPSGTSLSGWVTLVGRPVPP